MSIQPALFAQLPPQPPMVDPLERRKKLRDECLKRAGEAFRRSFTEFVIVYLTINGRATGEQIREAYAGTSEPQPHKWQAAGGVYAKLRRDGKVHEVGRENSRIYGNGLPVLELARTDESSN